MYSEKYYWHVFMAHSVCVFFISGLGMVYNKHSSKDEISESIKRSNTQIHSTIWLA